MKKEELDKPGSELELDIGEVTPIPFYDYVKAAGLDLPKDAADWLNKNMNEDPREVVYHLQREAEKEASRQFDELKIELAEQEAERKRLWGNKYPPVHGQKPGQVVDSPVPLSIPFSKGILPGNLPPLKTGRKKAGSG